MPDVEVLVPLLKPDAEPDRSVRHEEQVACGRELAGHQLLGLEVLLLRQSRQTLPRRTAVRLRPGGLRRQVGDKLFTNVHGRR